MFCGTNVFHDKGIRYLNNSSSVRKEDVTPHNRGNIIKAQSNTQTIYNTIFFIFLFLFLSSVNIMNQPLLPIADQEKIKVLSNMKM